MHGSERRVLASAIIGNIVEWYDFALYTAATPLVFGQLFFAHGQDSLLVQTEPLMVFAAGFVVRPLGGLFFGALGDRRGHREALRWTLLLIGIATALIGVLPTHARIGMMAPLLLLGLRLVQGFAAGGEWAGAVLIVGEGETALRDTPARAGPATGRGVAFALSQSGVAAGMVLGTAALLLARSLPGDAFLAYGWRLAFLAAVPFVALGVWLRGIPPGRPAAPTPSRPPAIMVLRRCGLPLACGMALRLAENGGVYLMTVFALFYGHARHIPDAWLLMGSMAGMAADGLAMPCFGWLADRIGAPRVYLGGAVALAVLAEPFFMLLDHDTLWSVVLAFTGGMALCHAPMIAVEPALLARLFPPELRYSGVAMAHELGAVLAGGISPLVAAGLYHATGGASGTALYMAALAAASAVALWPPLRRTGCRSGA
ncbi:major facilitator superfamily transporter [Gluconacetobacter sacchari DSM 12717]|uniref:MFS transporter n=2 Tax=Gluconacetobacter sacchari TaxID=92759 RepID=A0A7W4IAD9_9PROT|nr:MFS transporter [Gluconacetobacter sacchari]MBB2159188.1 MFS transporter [Gluconacetobacter sacchari]GBQ22189.1 major facilitator superfamily transporter [Gluconacetobacter sacchari DSM 12717]